MIKRIFFLSLWISAVLIGSTCSKDKEEPDSETDTDADTAVIRITTDKLKYNLNEPVKVVVTSHTDSMAYYFVCSSFEGMPPTIEKLENDIWKPYFVPVCNGFSSYCCVEFKPKAVWKDTLQIASVKGTFRIEYSLRVQPAANSESFYSKPFKVE
jgi:hypothetical protein